MTASYTTSGDTTWCVCRADGPGLESALLLRQKQEVAVHQSGASRFLAAMAGAQGGRLRVLGGVLPEGVMARILRDADDAVPRRMHETYREVLCQAGATSGSTEDWDALTETLRDSNWAAAWHVPVKLAAAGVPAERAAHPGFPFTAAQLEALAQLEHSRWCADRIVHGWRHAPTTDRAARLHRDLVPWEALDEEAQQKDRDTVLAIPGLLAGTA